MTAPLTVTIGGVSWTSITQSSLVIQQVIGKTVPTMQATLYDKGAAKTAPAELDEVIVTRSDTGAKIFGGLLAIPVGYTEGNSRYWDIQAQGYSVLLDRTVFYMSYGTSIPGLSHQGYSDKDVLADLFNNRVVGQNGTLGAASEINVGTYVQVGSPQLTPLNFIYSTAREVIELLANYVGYDYYVDPNKELHYYLTESVTPSWALSSTPGETLGGLTAVGYRNIRWKRDASRIINNYVVFGSTATSNLQTTIVAGNGSSVKFSLAFLGSAVLIQAPPGSATINVWKNTGTDLSPVWTAQTVGTANTTDNPASFDCMQDLINQTVNFASAPASLSKAFKVQYVFPFGGGVPYSVAGSISKYGRTLTQRLVASDANSAAAMQRQIANLQKQFSYGLEVITLTVDDEAFPSGTARFELGQWVPVKNTVLGINGNYWVHAIKTKVLGGTIREYELELRNWTTA